MKVRRTRTDFYGQKVAEQANLNASFLEARTLLNSAPSEANFNSAEEPGSMASDEGASEAQGSYDQTIAIQSNANRMILDSNQQQ